MVWNEAVRQSILGRLSGYRYTHTLGVEQAAIELAHHYGADVTKCAMAACLHDITKCYTQQEQLNLCAKYGIIPDETERTEWKMLHGKTAAAIAAHEYHAPADVVDAIACHTTGRAHMTILDKIVYLADYIEQGRTFDGVEEARRLAFISLEQALLYCFDRTLCELIERNKVIGFHTLAARNAMLLELGLAKQS